MSKFHYINNNQRVVNQKEEIEKRKPINNINVAGMGNTKKIFDQLAKKNKEKKEEEEIPTSFHQKKSNLPYNAAHYTTGAAAESFTSTAMGPTTASTRALIDEDEFMYKKIKSKAYARIITNYGNINVELFSDKVRSCDGQRGVLIHVVFFLGTTNMS
jgi:peptidyl-prolyl cis-trans isomerase-like protein 2